MPSLAQRPELTCPQCNQTFQAEIWQVVDAAERPDLLEKVLQGTIHDLPCPQCGNRGRIDAPLLIFRPQADPPVIFSPAQGTTPEQDQEHAHGLVGLLKEGLGTDWLEAWGENLPVIPRRVLPQALRQGLQAARQTLQDESQAEMERLRREEPETYQKLEEQRRIFAENAPLLQALQEFIQADT